MRRSNKVKSFRSNKSLAVIIPMFIAKQVKWEIGDIIEIQVEGDKLILSKAGDK